MDLDINREIRLTEESEYKNLYKWSLQEFTPEGKAIGSKLIPWTWSFNFELQDLSYRKSYKISKETNDGEKINYKSEETEIISGDMQASGRRALYGSPSFSMLGTDRKIKHIGFNIRKLENDEKDEICYLWGSVGYSYELDFRNDYSPDCLGFTIAVKSEKFNEIAKAISANELNSVLVRIGRISGFYSDWSPSISTDTVKVLTDYNEHKFIDNADGKIIPPRTGKVGEVELFITRKNKLQVDKKDEDEDPNILEKANEQNSSLENSSLESEHNSTLKLIYESLTQIAKTKNSLKIPLWIIALSLICLLLK